MYKLAKKPILASGTVFTSLRILLLGYVLLMVAAGAWLSAFRSTDWDASLRITVYPINGDGSEASQHYVNALRDDVFEPVQRFVEREARRYGLALQDPVRIDLAAPLQQAPPVPPPRGSTLAAMAWSLKMRLWAWQAHRTTDRPAPDIQVFVVYHDPGLAPVLGHSVGLRKGLLGIVYAYARSDFEGSNNVVLAHELLHTLGASDKYDATTALPRHPEGYAEPDRSPLHPQVKAEIMGGRIPIGHNRAAMPRRLSQAVVGATTASEINWIATP